MIWGKLRYFKCQITLTWDKYKTNSIKRLLSESKILKSISVTTLKGRRYNKTKSCKTDGNRNRERERSWVADWAKKLSSKLGAVVGSESAHIKIEKGRCVYIFEMTCRNHWFGSVETSWMRHTACRYAKGRGEPLTSRATFWGQRNEHIKPDDLILYTLYLTQGSFCMNVPSYLIS